jgi:hypothetical protein
MSTAEQSTSALPTYQPSKTVSQTQAFSSSTYVLLTRDPLERVSAFYRDALDQGGWHIVSATGALPWSTHLIAKRDKQGATIQISSTGVGSSISVTTYPV